MISRVSKTGSLLSSFVNVWLFGGNPDQSISSRAFTEDSKAWQRARKVIDKLFFWQENHCYNSFLTDLLYAEEVIEESKRV